LTARACTDLQILGGVYAPQVAALIDGTVPAPMDEEAWQPRCRL
jgi:hypothetical protein